MTMYDPSLSDDDWREANFSQFSLQSARVMGCKQPSADELIKAAQRFGVDGILETAILLSQKDYKKVETAVRQLQKGLRRGR